MLKNLENTVSMGGDLVRGDIEADHTLAPEFFVWAAKDVNSANLQRIQMVKGWVESGERKELVQDIACSKGGAPDARTKRCPDNGAAVDLRTCEIDDASGVAELQVTWRDEDFDPTQSAFYCARVLEDPVCRWSTHDALRIARELKPQVSGAIQERAWSSPIWYTP